MSKSGIYAVNTAQGVALASGSVYAPTSIIRRYGCNCQLAGNGITIKGAGYYNIDATVTVAAGAAGVVSAALYQDGNPISGATSSVTVGAVGDIVTLPLTALVRLSCDCSESTITVVVTGETPTSNNLAIEVVKE